MIYGQAMVCGYHSLFQLPLATIANAGNEAGVDFCYFLRLATDKFSECFLGHGAVEVSVKLL